MITVHFDGVIWIGKRAGFPGRVFGSTENEARSRIEGWEWRHLTARELRTRG